MNTTIKKSKPPKPDPNPLSTSCYTTLASPERTDFPNPANPTVQTTKSDERVKATNHKTKTHGPRNGKKLM
jgi:hypothetical protein